MTRPRPKFLNQVTHGVRRTAGRVLRISATPEVVNLVGYLLGCFAQTYGLKIHAGVAMLNHVHLSFTDPEGRRSDFWRDFNSQFTRALNALQDDWGSMWDCRKVSDTEALEPQAALGDVVYIALNPVRAGLVAHWKRFPGFMINHEHWGKELTFTRPNFFFSDARPEKVSFTPEPPPGYENTSIEGLKQRVRKLVRAEIEVERRARNANGESFLGAIALKKVKPDTVPTTPRQKKSLQPKWSSTCPELIKAAKSRLKNFYDQFFRATELLKDGERDVVFPEGTDLYWRLGLARAHPRRDYGFYPLAAAI